MARYMRTDLGPHHSHLSPPAVISPIAISGGLRIKLAAPSERERRLLSRRTVYRLRPPTVLTVPFTPTGPSVHVVRRPNPKTRSTFVYPIVIRPATAAWGFIGIQYVRTPRARPKSELPTIIVPPPSIVNPGLRIKLTVPSETFRKAQRVSHRLYGPTVVAGAVFYGPQATLTYSRRGAPKSGLRPPTVVSTGITFGLQTALSYSRRGASKSDLRPPTVVAPVLAPHIQEHLAYARRGAPKSELRLPAVISAPIAPPTVATNLAYSRRGKTRSELPVTIVAGAPPNPGLRIKLAPPFTGQRRARSRLSLVPLAQPGIEIYGPATRLAPSSRGRIASRLWPPVVVDAPLEQEGGILVTLAPQRRGIPKSRLEPPTVTTAPAVILPTLWLTYARRGVPKPKLRPPTVVAYAAFFSHIELTYSRRGRGRAELVPPAVVSPVLFFGPVTTFAPQRRGIPKSRLYAPTVISAPAFQQVFPPFTAYSRRGQPKSFLRAPTVVFPFFAQPTSITLAPQRRGRPLHYLLPPIIPPLAPPIKRVPPWIRLGAGWTRKAAHSHLAPPSVIAPPSVFIGPEVKLAYSRRGVPKSRLEPVLAAFQPFRPLSVHLTYSRRGRPITRLEPGLPGLPPFRGLYAHLSYSRRGVPKSRLKAPTVVFPFIAQPLTLSLAPQYRGKPKPHLAPPAILRTAGTLEAHLTYSRRGVPKSILRKPTVIDTRTYYGPRVDLTRIKHPPVHHFLVPPLVVQPICYGQVVGGDSNPYPESMVDSGENPYGGTSAPSGAGGVTGAQSIVSGEIAPDGEQAMTDERREGC